ncbi:MAG TPA: biotin-dependent carboxyltransferase family protein [Candidatus Limnocylindria bacterium]
MTVEVIDGGLLTSVQDAGGRAGWRHLGVPVGGAADPWSARLANRLVGNPDDAALLEVTLIGPTLRFAEPTTVALVGDMSATVDGLPMRSSESRTLRAGSVLRVADGPDARAWLAIRGGVDVPAVLGSRSTDLRSQFGGFEGRALRAGDTLAIGQAAAAAGGRWLGAWPDGPIRITDGPHADVGTRDALVGGRWTVSTASDRTGVRLEGPSVAGGGEVRSMGLPLGAIQLPPDGNPIVTGVDRPVTGGYAVPAVVAYADIGRLARLRPGDAVRFAQVPIASARRATLELERELTRVG